MSEGLVHLDANDRIVFTNRRFCEMIGYPEEELIGQNASQLLLDEEGRKIVEKANQRRRQGIADDYELQLMTSKGNMICSLVGAVPTFDTDGNIIGSMSVHTDITERKRAEEQLLPTPCTMRSPGLEETARFPSNICGAHGPRLATKNLRRLFGFFDGFKLITFARHRDGDSLLK